MKMYWKPFYYLPYREARSNGVSSRQFLILGSAPCLRSNWTASRWPYCAAEWSAVSLSEFYNNEKKIASTQDQEKNSKSSTYSQIHIRNGRSMGQEHFNSAAMTSPSCQMKRTRTFIICTVATGFVAQKQLDNIPAIRWRNTKLCNSHPRDTALTLWIKRPSKKATKKTNFSHLLWTSYDERASLLKLFRLNCYQKSQNIATSGNSLKIFWQRFGIQNPPQKLKCSSSNIWGNWCFLIKNFDIDFLLEVLMDLRMVLLLSFRCSTLHNDSHLTFLQEGSKEWLSSERSI